MKDIAKKLIKIVEKEPDRTEFSLATVKKELGITQKQAETLCAFAEPFFSKMNRAVRFRDRKANSKTNTVKKDNGKKNNASVPIVTEKYTGG